MPDPARAAFDAVNAAFTDAIAAYYALLQGPRDSDAFHRTQKAREKLTHAWKAADDAAADLCGVPRRE